MGIDGKRTPFFDEAYSCVQCGGHTATLYKKYSYELIEVSKCVCFYQLSIFIYL